MKVRGDEMNKVYHLQREPKVVFLNKKAMKSFIKMSKNKRRMSFISGSIISLVAVMAIFNEKLVVENNRLIAMQDNVAAQGQSRGIASVPSLGNQAYQNAFQAKMALELTKSLEKEKAILAKAPSKEDVFLKGHLAGNYKVKKDTKNSLVLSHLGGEMLKIGSMNALLLDVVEAFYEGEFQEISRISKADTSTEFMIKSASGETANVIILHDEDQHLLSIEMK